MALGTVINPSEGLNMLLGSQFIFDGQDPAGVNDATRYSWLTPGGDDVQAFGTGITFVGGAGNGDPLSGTIDELTFDFDDNGILDYRVENFSGDLVEMTTGNDLLNQVFGGADTINGTEFNDFLKGVGGNDSLFGDDGNDTLFGGDDNDTLNGGLGNDNLQGQGGNDSIIATSGSDTAIGGSGNDTIRIDGGNNDSVDAGSGDDRVYATANFGAANADWDGGADNDWFDVSLISNDGREVDLFNSRWELTPGSATFESLENFENVNGGFGDELLRGSNGNNSLYGNAGEDSIFGNGGNDDLRGGGNADTISGGNGNDTITGGSGADDLSGGNNDDQFRYFANAAYDADTISGGMGTDQILLLNPGTFNFDAAGIDFNGLEALVFNSFGAEDKTVNLSGEQANDFAFSFLIDGNGVSGANDEIVINMGPLATLDLSLWTFMDWNSDDSITIFGDNTAETLTGTIQTDSINSGGGNDEIVLTEATANGTETIVGGDGVDEILVGSTGLIDISDAGTEISGIEEIRFSAGGNSTIRIGSDEINATFELDDVEIDGFTGAPGNRNIVEVVMNSTNVDLSAWTFDDWDETDSEYVQVTGDSSNETIVGSTERDRVISMAGNDSIATGAHNDTVSAGDGEDTISGGSGNDDIRAGDNDDTVNGDTGADSISAGGGDDIASGGSENDTIRGNAGADTLIGDAGNDSLLSGTGDDSVSGGANNDTIRGQTGEDTLLGGTGDDSINGQGDADSILGGSGNDTIRGENEADTLNGEDGEDLILGGTNADVIDGGADNDDLRGDEGNDTINGGSGNDSLRGGDGRDSLEGDGNNDTLIGQDGRDTLRGDGGDDSLNGGEGADSLDGGTGQDTLNGGAGDDTMNGGADGVEDLFIFDQMDGSDTIQNFANNVDTLQLNEDLWGGGLSASDVVSMFATNTGGGVEFAFAGGETIFVEGITGNQIANDLILV